MYSKIFNTILENSELNFEINHCL